MPYPKIAVQWDDFDEVYEVVRQVSSIAYKELARFADRTEAFEYAAEKAKPEQLGVVDLTDDE